MNYYCTAYEHFFEYAWPKLGEVYKKIARREEGTYKVSILALGVSFLASTAGAICGIGGGVIIKPTLDLFQMTSVSTISFLSGCTVLSMSLYSVGRGLLAHDSTVDFKTGTPLALGAALGGVFGKQLFTAVKEAASNPNVVGGVQAGCLAIVTIYTLAYTVNKTHIKTRQI